MELFDLNPKEVPMHVSGVDIVFRPFTLADTILMEEKFGGLKELQRAIEGFNFKVISSIAWYQLTVESQKKIISSVESYYIDPETGEEIKQKMKPIDKFRNLFNGMVEQATLLSTLVRCRGINMPDPSDESEVKKWAKLLKEATKQIQ